MVATRPESLSPRLLSGKYVLLIVVALGVVGAASGWWYQKNLQRRPLELWGSDAARLILGAGNVDLCRLEPAIRAPNPITVGGERYEVAECTDASAVRGFLHLRHSLLNDYSFDWTDAATGDHVWRYAARFRDGKKMATLLISDDASYAMLLETGARASIRPIAIGIKQVFHEAWIKEL